MTIERDEALEEIFATPSGRARTAGDAAQLAVDRLDGLITALERGQALGDEYGTATRRDVDLRVRDAAMALGRDALDGMRGLIMAESVNHVVPRIQDHAFEPLDDGWQRHGRPYEDAAKIAEEQREVTERARAQPSQLFRHLSEAVALAADLAGWSAWALL
jgi:hypothetical protein